MLDSPPGDSHSFEYIKWIVEARSSVLKQAPPEQDYSKLAHELLTAAVELLMPEIPRDDYSLFASEVEWHRRWALQDQSYPDLIRNTRVVDRGHNIERARTGPPAIYCTFHTGSYRLVPAILGAAGVPITLLASRKFVEDQACDAKRAYESMQKSLFGREDAECDVLEVLPAEDAQSALAAVRRIRSGRSVLVYLDGNTGVGGRLRKADLVRVRFLGQTILARAGVGFLSHLTSAPIVPVISLRRDWLHREVAFFDAILPSQREDRKQYCQTAAQRLYSLLEKVVLQYPSQWEGWCYVHEFLDLDAIRTAPDAASRNKRKERASNCALAVNAERFCFLPFYGKMLAFDRRKFQIIEVDEEMQWILSEFAEVRRMSQLDLDGLATQGAVQHLLDLDLLVSVDPT